MAMKNSSSDRESSVQTTCPYCGVGCGVDVKLSDGQVTGVSGTKKHPANLSRLCVKGTALHETLDLRSRLLSPVVDQQLTNWPHALNTVSERLQDIINKHGPDAVAFYVSGQLLTEDYYVANKLMKGFIGSANIDTNSRLCMSSAVAGYKRAFGSDTVPCDYNDLETTDLLVIVGSNTAWAHPVIYQRIVAAKKQRPEMRVVTIDPRRTATSDLSDLHLSLSPNTDTLLFSGLLHYLAKHDCLDEEFINQHCNGFEQTLSAATQHAAAIEDIADGTGLSCDDIRTFYQWFASTEKTVSLYSQGLNQAANGTDNSNAIINCHLATARIGKPGAGPFSITGQPNAMGGREVGGLSNQLAAHMELGDHAAYHRVSTFWQCQNLATQPGLKAIELFDAVESGKVRAVWVMGTNPAVSMPSTDRVNKALKNCELLIVSDCEANTDTTRYADILLPALAWGEKCGTVTNSERYISRQRAFLPAPGDAKADWWIVSQVAQRMGYGYAFNYKTNDQVFREHAALSAYENQGSRDFDIGALATISNTDYNNLQPTQWPCPANKKPAALSTRLFADGRFFTEDARARFIPIEPSAPPQTTSAYPYVFNSGRLRDQWHTMTRTSKSARLMQHCDEPYLEIHPEDAAREGIVDGQLVEASAANGGVYLAKAKFSEQQRIGSLFAPIHWNKQFSKSAKPSALSDGLSDPFSGQPAFKHVIAAIRAVDTSWQACVVSLNDLLNPDCLYWSRIQHHNTQRLELSGDSAIADRDNWLSSLSGASGTWMTYHDETMGTYRAACSLNNKLQAVVYYTEKGDLPARSGIDKLFDLEITANNSRAILAGRAPDQEQDTGAIICACYNVGENSIRDAISKQSCNSTDTLGQALRCGTNCGSCLPELRTILSDYKTSIA